MHEIVNIFIVSLMVGAIFGFILTGIGLYFDRKK
jgi:hypothetical protein